MKHFRTMLFLGLFSAASAAHSDQLPMEAEIFGNLQAVSVERLSEQQLSTTQGEVAPFVVWFAGIVAGSLVGNEVSNLMNTGSPSSGAQVIGKGAMNFATNPKYFPVNSGFMSPYPI